MVKSYEIIYITQSSQPYEKKLLHKNKWVCNERCDLLGKTFKCKKWYPIKLNISLIQHFCFGEPNISFITSKCVLCVGSFDNNLWTWSFFLWHIITIGNFFFKQANLIKNLLDSIKAHDNATLWTQVFVKAFWKKTKVQQLKQCSPWCETKCINIMQITKWKKQLAKY